MPEPTKEDRITGCIVISCWLPLFLSFFLVAVPRAFPIFTNIYQLANSGEYVDTNLIVMAAHYESGGMDGMRFCWADGTIEADNSKQQCALIFGYSHVASEEKLQAMVPAGTKFSVKYNPDMMKTPIQGSTLRVILNEPDDAFKLLWRSTASHLVWALGSLALSSVLVYYVALPRWKTLKEKFPDSGPVSSRLGS